MRKFFRNTAGGKVGSIDGLNLFFGALLGANLGTMQSLALYQYVKLIIVLAGSVMVLRMISTAEDRRRVFAVLALYVLRSRRSRRRGCPTPTCTNRSQRSRSGSPACCSSSFRPFARV